MNSPISKNKRSTEESTDEFGSFVMLPTYDFSSHLDNYRRERNKYMNYLVCYDWIYPLDNAYLLHYLKVIYILYIMLVCSEKSQSQRTKKEEDN